MVEHTQDDPHPERQTNSQIPGLCSLPSELIIKILGLVDLPVLLRCKSVCRLLQTIIDNAVFLQYKIELAAAGMVDGPPSDLSTATRLDMLRKHQAAWEDLKWVEHHTTDVPGGFPLCGSIIAQLYGPRGFQFTRFRARYRDIPERKWAIEDVGFKPMAYAMDDRQDLLVVLERVKSPNAHANEVILVHALTMSSGSLHALASESPVCSFRCETNLTNLFSLEICGEHIGIRFPGGRIIYELVVFNWRTGTTEMHLRGDIFAFAFLTVDLIIAAISVDLELDLRILDLNKIPSDPILQFRDADYVCRFSYDGWEGEQGDYSRSPMTIRSGPSASPQAQVPFYLNPDNRLFLVTIPQYSRNLFGWKHICYIPASALMSHVAKARNGSERVHSWEELWAQSAQMWVMPTLNWHFSVFGSALFAPIEDGPINRRTGVELFDFNPLAFRRSLLNTGDSGRSSTNEQRMFGRVLKTPYPYRVKHLSLPDFLDEEQEIYVTVADEDNILVLVGGTMCIHLAF